MTTDPRNALDSPQDPRDPEAILRVLLGTASDAERRTVRDAVSGDPDAARLAGILADMRAAFAAERDESLDAPPASMFENARALGAGLPVPPSWFDRASALVLSRIDGAIDAVLGGADLQPVPALRGASGENLATFEGALAIDGEDGPGGDAASSAAVRLDASAVRERDGAVILVVQCDVVRREDAATTVDQAASLAGDCAVLDADSGAVLASTLLGDEGSALVRLDGEAARARAVDIAVRIGAGACVARGILLS